MTGHLSLPAQRPQPADGFCADEQSGLESEADRDAANEEGAVASEGTVPSIPLPLISFLAGPSAERHREHRVDGHGVDDLMGRLAETVPSWKPLNFSFVHRALASYLP
jgi:hypothetical protein